MVTLMNFLFLNGFDLTKALNPGEVRGLKVGKFLAQERRGFFGGFALPTTRKKKRKSKRRRK